LKKYIEVCDLCEKNPIEFNVDITETVGGGTTSIEACRSCVGVFLSGPGIKEPPPPPKKLTPQEIRDRVLGRESGAPAPKPATSSIIHVPQTQEEFEAIVKAPLAPDEAFGGDEPSVLSEDGKTYVKRGNKGLSMENIARMDAAAAKSRKQPTESELIEKMYQGDNIPANCEHPKDKRIVIDAGKNMERCLVCARPLINGREVA
jgi:hypothetical protein